MQIPVMLFVQLETHVSLQTRSAQRRPTSSSQTANENAREQFPQLTRLYTLYCLNRPYSPSPTHSSYRSVLLLQSPFTISKKVLLFSPKKIFSFTNAHIPTLSDGTLFLTMLTHVNQMDLITAHNTPTLLSLLSRR